MICSIRRGALVFAFLVGVLGAGVSAAQETSDSVKRLQARVNLFLEGVSRGNTQDAYEELLRGSQLLKQTEALDALIEKTGRLDEDFGQYREFEPVDSKQVGRDLVLLRYLYKCENFPVVWYFTFYRPPAPGEVNQETDNWRVIIVRFDTELELLRI